MSALISEAQIAQAVGLYIDQSPKLRAHLDGLTDADYVGLSREVFVQESVVEFMAQEAQSMGIATWEYMHRLIGTDEEMIAALRGQEQAAHKAALGI